MIIIFQINNLINMLQFPNWLEQDLKKDFFKDITLIFTIKINSKGFKNTHTQNIYS